MGSEGMATTSWQDPEWSHLGFGESCVRRRGKSRFGGCDYTVRSVAVVSLLSSNRFRSKLLLSHAPDQAITQKRIEAFLGAMPGPMAQEDPKATLHRTEITEIYILHVLPRVGEWEYAKEFAQFSPEIDEEQKEVRSNLFTVKCSLLTRVRCSMHI